MPVLRSIDEGDKRNRPVNDQQRSIVQAGDEHGDGAIDTIVRAYEDLITCRPIGMIAGLIPWTAIQRWCEVEGLDDDASRVVIAAVRYVDVQDFKKRNVKSARPTGRR